MNTIVVGCAGNATCGKDTFANLLIKRLSEKGITAKRYALADALKSDLYFFLKQNFDIDIFDCTLEQKNLVRPILVEYGRAKRIQTKGTFWTNLVEEKIKQDRLPVAVVSDVRYWIYPDIDELPWLKNKLNGVLVYIDRYDNIDGKRRYTAPPNHDELENNPKLKKAADWHIDWPSVPIKEIELRQMPYIDKFLEFLKPRLKELQCGQ